LYWSVTVRDEYILRVPENRVLRRISGPAREEVAGGWRRLHNEELHNLYVSPNIIRVMKSGRMGGGGLVAGMGEMTAAYRMIYLES
jgi:alpha-D-ribose 1-methylphosphonate 5-triphosphate synthase subunit PhnG